MNTNNQNMKKIKRFFNCEKCNYLYEQHLPLNIKPIKCNKCGNILREISENDYLIKTFNFVKGKQSNNIQNMKSNKHENMNINNNFANLSNNIINNNQINKIVNVNKNEINNTIYQIIL